MRIIKQLFNFYLNSSLHVALAVFSLTWITLLEYHMSFDTDLLFFVFFAAIIGYNYVKYFGIAKFYNKSLANSIVITRLKAIQTFSFFCFLLMCYFIIQLQNKTLFFIVGFGLLTFFYAMPFLPKHIGFDSKQNLRSISGLKVYLIALVWVGVTVCLPVLNNKFEISDDVFLTALQRFLYIIVLMVPFEIRDLKYDSLKLATIPQKLGVKKTKIVAVLIMFLFFVIEFFKDDISFQSILITAFMVVITSLFVAFSKKEQSRYYSSFWVEALPVLWLFLWFIFC